MKRIGYLIVLCIVLFNCGSDNGGDPVIITPPSNEKPVAVNDDVTGVEDTVLIIGGLLNNDTVITGSRITSIDTNSSNGASIVDNRNGTFSYMPLPSFVGSDSFNYTLCDNDVTPRLFYGNSDHHYK